MKKAEKTDASFYIYDVKNVTYFHVYKVKIIKLKKCRIIFEFINEKYNNGKKCTYFFIFINEFEQNVYYFQLINEK